MNQMNHPLDDYRGCLYLSVEVEVERLFLGYLQHFNQKSNLSSKTTNGPCEISRIGFPVINPASSAAGGGGVGEGIR